MTFLRISLRAFLLVACLGAFISGANAQYRASVSGAVTDPQGAAVSGATVTLRNLETNQTQTATTDENGLYNFSALPPSRFSITVEKAGFKKKQLENFGIIPDQANAVNVSVDIGEASETVTVSGDSTPLIDTETASGSGTVKAEQYQKLPSFGRDPFQLLQLAPGAFGDGAQGAGGGTSNLPGTTVGGTGATAGIFATENGGQVTANGARTGENNYTIDGVGMTSVSWGGTAVITPNEDSIKEVKIITDNYDAEYGRYRGAQVQIISQNGTNQYHGSLFLKAHRPGLDAFQKYNGYSSNVVRDDNRFNDYGGTVGGPILKNKLFAFFSYETISNNTAGATGGGWYETDAFRTFAPAGSNAAKYFAAPGIAPSTGTIAEAPGDNHDCSTIGLTEGPYCHFIAGQGIDLGSPLSLALGTSDPSYGGALQPGFGGGLDGVADIAFINGIQSPNSTSNVQYNGRVDFNPTSKDLIAFSMYYVPVSTTSLNGNGAREFNLFHHSVKNNAYTAIWDRTFSPTLVNEVRVNAAGWRWKDLDVNPDGNWGLPPIDFVNAFNSNPVIGNMNGDNGLNGYGLGAPGTFDQWTYGLKDVVTKVLGSHTLKFGGEATRLLFVDNAPWNARPTYYFNNMWDFLNDAPNAEVATFNPISGIPTDFRKDTRSNLFGFFIQDNYKVKSNLTITVGLRWEYFGPISEKNGNLAVVQLGAGPDLISGVKVRTGGNLYDASTNNFGPQLGFAWTPHGLFSRDFRNKLVLRGGFGVAYNGLDEAISLNGRSNPPFLSASGILQGSQIAYANTFPDDLHSFTGYGSNPAAIATFDPATNLPVPGTANFAPVALTAYQASWPTTTTYHYTLEGEYDLGHNWVASLGYQGSLTRHLTQQYNLNLVAAAHGLALNPVVPGIDFYANDGSAHFNAMLAEVKHPFGHSFDLDVQYRLSRSIDSGSNNFANGQYQYDIGTNVGPSDFDVTHAFKVFGVWSPKIFRGSNSWMEKIAGGWSISGIFNAHSGFPWNPVYHQGDLDSNGDPLFSGSSGFGGSGDLRPAAYLGGALNDNSNTAFIREGGNFPNGAQSYFTSPSVVAGPNFNCVVPTAVTVQCPLGQVPYGPIPTAPGVERNAFRGPRYFDVDANVSKSFGLPRIPILGENAKLEFRASFYNLFNKVNLTNINNNIMSDDFGRAQGALGARTIEMQARFSF